MANITTYLENRILAQSVGIAPSPAWHTSTKLGLFIDTPTVDYLPNAVTGTEVGSSTYGYVRKSVSWNTSTSGVVSNTSDITWTATGPWNAGNSGSATPIGYIGVFDGVSSANNLLWFGSLSAKILMAINGDTFTLPAGSLTLTLT